MPKWLFRSLAQEQYDHRAKQKGWKSRLTPNLKKKIEYGLNPPGRLNIFVAASSLNKI